MDKQYDKIIKRSRIWSGKEKHTKNHIKLEKPRYDGIYGF